MVSTFLGYQAWKFGISCKLEKHVIVLPVRLTQPITALVIIVLIHHRNVLNQAVALLGNYEEATVMESFSFSDQSNNTTLAATWLSLAFMVAWISSVCWLTLYVWPRTFPYSIDHILGTTGYCTLLCDQSLLQKSYFHTFSKVRKRRSDESKKRKIIACATMWHETEEEMVGLLRSIFSMYKYLYDR